MGKVLNLQELFGQSRDIVIKGPQGVEYALRKPDEMGPKEIVRFERVERMYGQVVTGIEGGMREYREKYEAVSEEEREKLPTPEDHEDEWLERIESLLYSILAMLNKDLAKASKEWPFHYKAKVLQFYNEQLEEEAKNATTESPPPAK